MTKFKEAVAIDGNNYRAHLWVAHLSGFCYEEPELAKKERWQAINMIDEWDIDLTTEIICQIHHSPDINKKKQELHMLKQHLKMDAKGEGVGQSIAAIDAAVDSLEDRYIQDLVLGYDLKEIVRIAGENNVKVILQTYSSNYVADPVRKISRNFNVALVDNAKIFQEKLRDAKFEDFFIADGHCNANGYRVIAENIYNTLVNRRVLAHK
ncbi:hypothetical protein ACFL5X_04315 [Candidatus Omnitrophota bacterium]